MLKCTTEFVMMFWDEHGEPIGLIHENGKREIYTVKRASKQDLTELFNAENIPATPGH